METNASTTDRPPSVMCTVGARLHRLPVHGSVVLSRQASQPEPLYAWATFLPVQVESASRARAWTGLFLEQSRRSSNLCPDYDDALLLVSELVTNAVKAMAVAMASESFTGLQFIELSLRLFDGHLLIEVIDSSQEVPAPKLEKDSEALGWRGLAVVDQLSKIWGWNWHMGRSRKVVWCKLKVIPHETPTRKNLKMNDKPEPGDTAPGPLRNGIIRGPVEKKMLTTIAAIWPELEVHYLFGGYVLLPKGTPVTCAATLESLWDKLVAGEPPPQGTVAGSVVRNELTEGTGVET